MKKKIIIGIVIVAICIIGFFVVRAVTKTTVANAQEVKTEVVDTTKVKEDVDTTVTEVTTDTATTEKTEAVK